MNFIEYAESVRENILDYLPQEYQDTEVHINKVNKNNGLELTAISLRGKENISPNIYLEPFFQKYQDGMTLEESLKSISGVYQREMNRIPVFPIEGFTYDNIKDKLYVTLVNAEKNEKMLEDLPHKNYEDLASVYRIQVMVSPDNRGSIAIHNSHLKMFGVDIDTLHEQAMTNMKQMLPYFFESLNEILAEMMGGLPEEFMVLGAEISPMWVLSNSEKMQGASYMLDDTVLQDISDRIGGNLIILPSSVHECIILREDENMNKSGTAGELSKR
ncbi:DUF5688 family protein [Lacrimispora saccharolytica]|uniref:Uncharacterized protein n=1 Tax=Lacrimispora saccharolytica (strain ATCC 35040 / DSM 2544 / NRCC 2533 / WM1) TaxID=610130 RepID=D9R5V1_LACSW|nr:DUF5688 family protein [Lacrimispora saccharolytica]ADL05284.1 hypothetical protein Closa_2739 [[Clostridium] saccharolyticum WM1]